VVGADLRKYLPKIQTETTVVWGEYDYVLPLSLTRVYAKLLRNRSTRVVWGAGHDPHLTHFEQTLRVLQESVE
jgi:pimeloyl-ACP methyl ester carboxylesterase